MTEDVQVVVAQGAPESRRLHKDVNADITLEGFVASCVYMANHGIGDVGVDVKRSGSRGPVARAFLAVDGAPRKGGTGQAQLVCALLRSGNRRMAPAQRVGRSSRYGVRQDRQDKHLCVPERVSVVTCARQSLGGNGAPLGPRTGLEHVEQRKAHRLLQL